MRSVASATVMGNSIRADGMRVGDRVRVKSREQLLATLDEDGRVDDLPFMPEMLAWAGQTLPISAVTHRTCDTVKTSGSSGTTRKLQRSVHLGDVRCDGSAHGGCQARCLIFWKEDWLEAVPSEVRGPGRPDQGPRDVGDVRSALAATTHGAGHTDDAPVYSCQATELLRATQFVSARDPRIWLKDLRSRNANLRTAAASLAVLLFNKWQSLSTRLPRKLRVKGGKAWPWFTPAGDGRPTATLDLKPGELVEVKSLSEIEATLDDKGAVRGLRFSAEMIPYCGQQARVLARVDRIIDEKTGRMLKLRDCIILEDVWCQGTFRALCRRKIYTYWREAWLRRVEPKPAR
jgi:hypothetical protein